MVEKTYHIAPYLSAFWAYLMPQWPIYGSTFWSHLILSLFMIRCILKTFFWMFTLKNVFVKTNSSRFFFQARIFWKCQMAYNYPLNKPGGVHLTVFDFTNLSPPPNTSCVSETYWLIEHNAPDHDHEYSYISSKNWKYTKYKKSL